MSRATPADLAAALPASARDQLAAARRQSLEAAFITAFIRASGWTRDCFDVEWRHGVDAGSGTTADRQIVPGRRFVWDFVHPAARVVVEVNGGQGQGAASGHGSWRGLHRDAEKANAATALGWQAFTLTTSMLGRDAVDHVAPIMAAVERGRR